MDEIKKLRRALEVTQEEKDRDSFLSGCLEVKPPNQKRKRNKGRREFQVDYYLSPIRDVREKLRCCQRAFLSVFFEISQRKINTIARTLFRTGGLSILKDKIEEIKFDGGHIQLIDISEKKKRVIQETQKKKKAASTSALSERKLTAAAQATAEVVVIPSLTITDHLLEQQVSKIDLSLHSSPPLLLHHHTQSLSALSHTMLCSYTVSVRYDFLSYFPFFPLHNTHM